MIPRPDVVSPPAGMPLADLFHSLRPGRCHDVRGVPGEEEPTVLHRFDDEVAHLHDVLLGDLSLLERPAPFVDSGARVDLVSIHRTRRLRLGGKCFLQIFSFHTRVDLAIDNHDSVGIFEPLLQAFQVAGATHLESPRAQRACDCGEVDPS
jgi:hypothetical protein